MVACLLAAALAAAPPKLAVLQVVNGEGVPQSTAAAITEAVVAEVRKQSRAEVITQREISSILSLEKQKAMLGCETDACMAELGGALGADRLVAGDMAKLGESFLLHLRVVDVRKVRVTAQADRRLRGGTIDDVLDVLPAMVGELFPTPTPTPTATAPATPAAAIPVAATAGAPPVGPALSKKAAGGWTEEEETLPKDLKDRLWILTDDNGLVIAVVPFQGIGDAPFYAGDGEKLYRQRIIGGGKEGNVAASFVFWEPRARVGAESELSIRGGQAALTCGKRTIHLRVVGPSGVKKALAEARFYAPPFRRIPHLLARDDQGSYFFVDAARDPWSGRAADRQDLRLRYGRRGALAPVALVDTVSDPSGLVLVSGGGRLVARGPSVEWVGAAGKQELIPVDLRDGGPFVYGELGAYGARLGTPCDGMF
jgi:TolB-like protein